MSVKLSSRVLNARTVSGSVTALGSTIDFASEAWAMPDLTEGGSIQITLEIDEGPAGRNYAPHLVRVEASATGYESEGISTNRWDESDHKVYFIHDWGEPGEKFTVPENLIDEHRDRNVSISPNAAHVYRKAGSYNYHVLAYDAAGNYGYAKATFTVKRDDFNEYETVVVASDGDFTGCPSSASKITSLDQIDDITIGGKGQKCKVWLKRGLEYDATKRFRERDYFFDAWGSGDRPVANIKTDVLFTNYTDSVVRFSNLKFQGIWSAVNDMATDRSLPRNPPSKIITFTAGSSDIIFDNCVERGTIVGAEVQSSGESRICFHEHDRSDCRDYLLLGQGEELNVVYLGGKEVQMIYAANGTMNRDQFARSDSTFRYIRNSHNGIRLPFARSLIVSGSDMFARCGWTFQNIFIDNPILRINTATTIVGEKVMKIRVSINRSNIEGSITNAEASGENVNMLPISGVVEQNNLTMTPSNGALFYVESCGWTLRNNKFQRPDTPSVPSGPSKSARFVLFNLTNEYKGVKVTHPDNYLVPNYVYNNTFASQCQRETINIDFEDHNRSFAENNVSYHPNVDVPIIADGPLDTGSIGFEARYAGLKRGFEFFNDYHTLQAEVLPNETVVLPYAPDWYGNMTSADTFAGHWDRHQLEIIPPGTESKDYAKFKFSPVAYENAAFAFEADGIHVTNLSASTWPSGAEVTLILDRGDQMMEMDERFAAPAGTIGNYGISQDSGAYEDASGLVSMSDFYGRLRPGTGFKDAPDGVPSRGALEPV